MGVYYSPVNFVLQAYFVFFIKSKAENQLKFQQHSAPAQSVRTNLKLLRREMPDFIIEPNLWLLNISDFSTVDYRILACYRSGSVNSLCEMLIS